MRLLKSVSVIMILASGSLTACGVDKLKARSSTSLSSFVNTAKATKEDYIGVSSLTTDVVESEEVEETTDQEIIDAYIERLQNILEAAKANEKAAEEKGITIPENIKEINSDVAARTQEMIKRLETDDQFRKLVVDQVRNNYQGAKKVDLNDSVQLEKLCAGLKQALKNDKFPQIIRDSMNELISSKCN